MNKLNILMCLILVAALSLVSSPSNASSADITGAYSVYATTSTQVQINVERITNNTTSRTTGTLYLTLRYTLGSSPLGPGYNVSRESLSYIGSTNGQLQPNAYFSNISVTTQAQLPPAGTYYVHILVSEYPDLDTYIDYVTFSSTETVGGGGSSGGGNDLQIVGSVAYTIQGNNVEIRVDRIENRSATRTTGTLYAKLWFTTGPGPVGTGYQGAEKAMSFIGSNGTLPPNTHVTGISFTTPFTPPPNGTYYVHLIISQYPNVDTILDSVTFDNKYVRGNNTALPITPTLTVATDGSYSDRVSLSWSPVAAATSYKVYRSSVLGANGTLIKTTSGTSYDDYAGAAGTHYFYSIQACNSAGCSPYSSQNEGWRVQQPTTPPPGGGGGATTATRADVMTIGRLYAASFNRLPDSGGLRFWVRSFEEGTSVENIAAHFVTSPEFTSNYGSLSNLNFVRQLYRNVLGREAEQSGLNFWTNHLNNGVSRARVLAEISASGENIQKTSTWILTGSTADWTITAPSSSGQRLSSAGTFSSFVTTVLSKYFDNAMIQRLLAYDHTFTDFADTRAFLDKNGNTAFTTLSELESGKAAYWSAGYRPGRGYADADSWPNINDELKFLATGNPRIFRFESKDFATNQTREGESNLYWGIQDAFSKNSMPIVLIIESIIKKGGIPQYRSIEIIEGLLTMKPGEPESEQMITGNYEMYSVEAFNGGKTGRLLFYEICLYRFGFDIGDSLYNSRTFCQKR
ncbi:MAG: DUF4214 domain-containing protein [Nitrospira sp.]|nr:DUF4214 domain-containing protein [Nitrospira sp.]